MENDQAWKVECLYPVSARLLDFWKMEYELEVFGAFIRWCTSTKVGGNPSIVISHIMCAFISEERLGVFFRNFAH
jgi:hypothetical protein